MPPSRASPSRSNSSPRGVIKRAAVPPSFRSCDLLIRGGNIYDGRGRAPVSGDVAIVGDRIAAVADDESWHGRDEVDARDLAVAPGFINMLSWATESLLVDGCAQSDIRQGVTLEVMGEGFSMGPLTDAMKEELT